MQIILSQKDHNWIVTNYTHELEEHAKKHSKTISHVLSDLFLWLTRTEWDMDTISAEELVQYYLKDKKIGCGKMENETEFGSKILICGQDGWFCQGCK